MGFVRPELLLLLLPVAWLLHRTRDATRATQGTRALVALLLGLALAAPYLRTGSRGRDLVFVVDRSLSMPAGSDERAQELIRLAGAERREGDRLGVVTFGRRAAIEALPDPSELPERFERALDGDGSDLAEALETALTLIPEERPGSLFVLSDGESQGREVDDVARRAFARGVRVDAVALERPAVPDLAVERLDLPDEVAVGEPFQFSAWVHADVGTEATFVLRRNGLELSRGERSFAPGRTRLLFRDVLEEGGVATYQLSLLHAGDRIAENDHGLGALLALGNRPLLVLNHDGQEDTLVRALRKGGLDVVVRAPEQQPLSPTALLSFRAVVLENVPAGRLGRRGMEALEDFVVERGGGLLMTGGRASFGVGGYHRTPVGGLLPVSMELRQEHRKQGVGLVLVLDRSGSMAAPAGEGRTKMDLANSGAAAAIQLLSPIDSVGVLAVDTRPHVIQPLAPVEETGAILRRVHGIRSSGGGIYTRTGLEAAARQLAGTSHANTHVILFADAADAEQQEGVPELLETMSGTGTSVSVIALGDESDVHAGFLSDVAQRGGGEVYFTSAAEELPQLFARDTLTVARSTFVEEPTEVQLRAELHGLGELEPRPFPVLEGYNLNYLRPEASAGAVSVDEYGAPILAHWYQGIGRSAAYCGQIGGSHGANVVSWEGFAPLFVTLARWLVGQEDPGDLFAEVRREGSEAVVSVELDPASPTPPDTAHLRVRARHPDGRYADHVLERVAQQRFEARFELASSGVTLATLRTAEGRFLNLPPIVLPYSPEYERRLDPGAGRALLDELVAATGGELDPPAHTLLRGERATRVHRVVTRELLLGALLLFLLEVAARRLSLWGPLGRLLRAPLRLLGRARRAADAEASAGEPEGHEVPQGRPRRRRRTPAPDAPDGAAAPAGTGAPATRPRRSGDVGSALERARRQAGRKLDR